MICTTCFHHCDLKEGQVGLCKARINVDGVIKSRDFVCLSSGGLDPIEKKPLYHFYPHSRIFSIGFFGCNLSCPFCQNHEISQTYVKEEVTSPQEVVDIALKLKEQGNIGIAYTYSEPLVHHEFIYETAKLAREAGLKNVLVSNGCFEVEAVKDTLALMDAMNIDLKGFTEETYKRLNGDLNMVKRFIEYVYDKTHLEVTTLVVPKLNDSEEEFLEEVKWLASLSRKIPLHISRYFPSYKYRENPTNIALMRRFKEIAEQYLDYVYLGNV